MGEASPDKWLEYDVSGKVVAIYDDGSLNPDGSISYTGTPRIEYQYDDRGFRSYKLVRDSVGAIKEQTFYIRDASGTMISIYEYSGTDLYQKEIPLYGASKLGIYYPQSIDYEAEEYAYEISDHLGNVRSVVKRANTVFTATMEDNGQVDYSNPRVEEMQYFMNLTETEQVDARFNTTLPTDSVPDPNRSSYLTGLNTRIIGPAITLQVNKGDRVHMSANGKFEQQTTYNHDLPVTLFSSLGTTFADQFNGETAQTMETAFGDAFALLGTWGTSDPNKPRAFLNYMLFDENFDLIQLPGSSGFDQIDYGSGYDPLYPPSSVPFDNLELLIENVPQSGYLYIWLSNETAGSKVWFDDLRIQRTHNQITEETDYYPFGHILSQYKYDSKKSYRFGYQGEFAEEDEETGWNQFELRLYDGVVGRWLSVDPERQFNSPYNGMGNNPVGGLDQNGGWVLMLNFEGRASVGEGFGGTGSLTFSIVVDGKGNWGLSFTGGMGVAAVASASGGFGSISLSGTYYHHAPTINSVMGHGAAIGVHSSLKWLPDVEGNFAFGEDGIYYGVTKSIPLPFIKYKLSAGEGGAAYAEYNFTQLLATSSYANVQGVLREMLPDDQFYDVLGFIFDQMELMEGCEPPPPTPEEIFGPVMVPADAVRIELNQGNGG